MQPLLKDIRVGEVLGVDVKTLERWRREGSGPAFVRAGRQIRYRTEDIEEWLAARTTPPAA